MSYIEWLKQSKWRIILHYMPGTPGSGADGWGIGQLRFPTELVAQYTKFLVDNQCLITWDVPVGPDGTIADDFQSQFRVIGGTIQQTSE